MRVRRNDKGRGQRRRWAFFSSLLGSWSCFPKIIRNRPFPTHLSKTHLHGHSYLHLRRLTLRHLAHHPSSPFEINDAKNGRDFSTCGQRIDRIGENLSSLIGQFVVLKVVLPLTFRTDSLWGILNGTTLIASISIKRQDALSFTPQTRDGWRSKFRTAGFLRWHQISPV